MKLKEKLVGLLTSLFVTRGVIDKVVSEIDKDVDELYSNVVITKEAFDAISRSGDDMLQRYVMSQLASAYAKHLVEKPDLLNLKHEFDEEKQQYHIKSTMCVVR